MVIVEQVLGEEGVTIWLRQRFANSSAGLFATNSRDVKNCSSVAKVMLKRINIVYITVQQ